MEAPVENGHAAGSSVVTDTSSNGWLIALVRTRRDVRLGKARRDPFPRPHVTGGTRRPAFVLVARQFRHHGPQLVAPNQVRDLVRIGQGLGGFCRNRTTERLHCPTSPQADPNRQSKTMLGTRMKRTSGRNEKRQDTRNGHIPARIGLDAGVTTAFADPAAYQLLHLGAVCTKHFVGNPLGRLGQRPVAHQVGHAELQCARLPDTEDFTGAA